MTIQVDKVEQTIAQDKPETNMNQQKVDPNAQQNKTESPPADTQEDPNWRAFREARKKDREEKQDAQKRAADKEAEVAALKAAMEAAFAGQQRIANTNYNDNLSHEETEDERIEKKVQAVIAAREVQAEQARVQREQQEYPTRLVHTYSDFHQTIAQDNLDYLDFHYPEVSRPLQRLSDGYDKWSDIYKAIKKFVPNTNSKKDAARADSNFNKPKSISSPTLTPPGEPGGGARLTDEKRAANWERMQKILKRVS